MTDIASLQTALAGRYTIERELGAGGMATVYLAHDVRHDRKVAVKVLRPELAAVIGAERFLAEIKTTANLQHPHILPLHDSGEADAFLFYVMPYVEGDSLRDRLQKEKQLPVDEAVRIATEVAEALDYAHRQEVIHRDIKPENILLHDGRPLVADFGIALAVTEAGGTRMTETGMSLGTPHYMSPEQAMGERDITARSDIYALGCVLYEMLTGEPPFTGPTAQAVVARVMTESPRRIATQRHTVDPHVEAAVEQALEKLPADRFASAAAFAAALREGTGLRRASPRMAAEASGRPARVLAGVSVLALAASALAAWGWLRPTGATGPPELVRFALEVPEGAEPRPRIWEPSVAVSPDGRTVVYVGVSDREQQLYRRDLGDRTVRPIPDTEGAAGPFFSPDGRWVGFRKGSEIQKVDLRGGGSVTLASLESSTVVAGAVWSTTDSIFFGHEIGRGIYVIAGSGQSTPQQAFEPDSGVLYWWPSLLPDERWMIVGMNWTADSDARMVAAISRTTGEVRPLVQGARWARYLGSGWLLVQMANLSMAVMPIDPADPRSSDRQILIDIEAAPTSSGAPNITWAPNGTAFFVSGGTAPRRIVLVDRTGHETDLLDEVQPYQNVRLSPDGAWLAYRVEWDAGDGDLWLYDRATRTPTRLTLESDNFYPVWSRDGRRIFFTSRRDGIAALWWKTTDGSGRAERLVAGDEIRFPGSVTPSGDRLLYRQISPTTGFDLYQVELEPGATPEPVLATPFDEGSPMLSPDGRWLAYVSNESGRNEIYLRRYPEGEARWQVSANGGTEPMWHPQGRELFFRRETTLMSARLQLDDRPVVIGRDSLFSGPYYANVRWPEYDVMPDGDHFLMIREAGSTLQPVVVLGWVQDVIRRAGQQTGGE